VYAEGSEDVYRLVFNALILCHVHDLRWAIKCGEALTRKVCPVTFPADEENRQAEKEEAAAEKEMGRRKGGVFGSRGASMGRGKGFLSS